MEQESSVYLNRKDMQSEILRFRTSHSSATMGLGFRVYGLGLTLRSSAMMEVERSVDLINMKSKR